MSNRPPRLAAWLLQRLLDRHSSEAVAGDLEEEFARVRHDRGPSTASRWYWRAAAQSVVACRITGQRRAEARRMDFDDSGGASARDLLKPAFRQFRDHPLYAITCIGTLALAVGAACVSFSVVKRAFLDPLPYHDDSTLVSLLTLSDGDTSAVSAHVLEDLRAANSPLTGFAPIRPSGLIHTTGDATTSVTGNIVTAEYFALLGVAPVLGRVWTGQEPDAVIVSWNFWQKQLQADPGVLGRSVMLDDRARHIVGVLPAEFVAPYFVGSDVWTPLDVPRLLTDIRSRRTLTVLARRAPGSSQSDVDVYLGLFSANQQQTHPAFHGKQAWVAIPLRDELIGPSRPALVATGVAAVLLLLIVAANIAGLSTAHAVATRHQLAIRAALGATRTRLFIEQLVDSVTLALVGSGLGIAVAYGLIVVVVRYQRQFLERLAPVTLDGVTIGAGLIAGLLIGGLAALLPRRVVRAASPGDALRRSRGGTGDARVTVARSSLVVAQVAFALILLIGAGLVVRTVQHLLSVDLGFDSHGLTALTVNLPGRKYQADAAQIQFERNVLERVSTIRGVKAATASVGFPIVGGMMAGLAIKGHPADAARNEVAYLSVAPNFMATVGAHIVEGRDLAQTDTATAPRVVLINETMARMFWPQGGAVGAQVQIGPGSTNERWITVVGIVKDLRTHGPTEEIRPASFGSTLQYSWPRRFITVRTDGHLPVTLAAELRAAVHAVDPGVAVREVTMIDTMVDDRTARYRLVMLALTLFGGVALALCISGLYAVVALTSRLRRREYAIRLALGARRTSVRWMVLRQAFVLAGAGAVIGLTGAAGGTRAIGGLLHGVAPIDGPVFVTTSVFLMALVAIAAWLPARQAERVNPTEALRAD